MTYPQDLLKSAYDAINGATQREGVDPFLVFETASRELGFAHRLTQTPFDPGSDAPWISAGFEGGLEQVKQALRPAYLRHAAFRLQFLGGEIVSGQPEGADKCAQMVMDSLTEAAQNPHGELSWNEIGLASRSDLDRLTRNQTIAYGRYWVTDAMKSLEAGSLTIGLGRIKFAEECLASGGIDINDPDAFPEGLYQQYENLKRLAREKIEENLEAPKFG